MCQGLGSPGPSKGRGFHLCLPVGAQAARLAVRLKWEGCWGHRLPALWPPSPACPPAPPQVNDRIYASDANSTAYKYPLADASILSVKGAPAGAAATRDACGQNRFAAGVACGKGVAGGCPLLAGRGRTALGAGWAASGRDAILR